MFNPTYSSNATIAITTSSSRGIASSNGTSMGDLKSRPMSVELCVAEEEGTRGQDYRQQCARGHS